MAHGKVVVVVEVMNIVSAKPSHRLSNIYRARLMRLQFDGGWRVVKLISNWLASFEGCISDSGLFSAPISNEVSEKAVFRMRRCRIVAQTEH